MFGGIGLLLHGNMCVGVWMDSLILRICPDAYNQALTQPFVRELEITGRPMTRLVVLKVPCQRPLLRSFKFKPIALR